MKKILVTILCLPVFVFAQKLIIPSGQSHAMAQEIFDINGVKTSLVPVAFMWDLNDAKYEVPKGCSKHSIFAHEHWMAGVDDVGTLIVAAQTYKQSGSDFWAGPFSNN